MVARTAHASLVPSVLSVREIRRLFGASRERMGHLLGVSAKTVERWEASSSGPTNEMVRVRLAEMQQIGTLGHVVYTDEGFEQFLDSPLPVFGQRTACQLIALGETNKVLGALAADYEGLGF